MNAYLPNNNTHGFVTGISDKSEFTMQRDDENGSKLEQTILAPYTHLLQVKGKQQRTKIAHSFNHWLRLPEEKLHEIVDIVAMLHVGTLMFDDIQDNATLRRGIPAAHRVFGTPSTINASVHVLFLVLKKFLDLHPKAAEIYGEDFLEALRGQGADLYWRDNFLCPTVDEHMRIVEQKTGRMFSIPVRVGQLFSDYKTDLSELALLLGQYFQIRDDYCNLIQQEELEEWPGEEDKQADTQSSFCEDLTEGKFSLPIIHAMNTPARGQILDILRLRTEDVELKKNCLSLLEKAGSLQYTRDVLENLERRARAEIARLGGNPKMEACMDELLTWKQ